MRASIGSLRGSDAIVAEDLIYLCVPVCCLTIAEEAFRLAYQGGLSDLHGSGYLLWYGQFLIVPLVFGLAGFGVFQRLRHRWLPWTLGLILAIVAARSFRGAFYWPGTFDAFASPYWLSLAPLLLAILVQSLASRLLAPRFALPFALVSVVIGVAWVWIDSHRNIGLYSLTPYSRHWAVTAIVISTIALYTVGRRLEA